MAGTATDPDKLAVSDEQGALTWYSPDPTVQYGFCCRCGSSLFWRPMARSGHIVITAGSLDQPTGLRTTHAWWMAEHGDYHQRQPGLIEHSLDG
jgi:hypothetical protein